RLHVIVGDSTMSEVTTLLKVASTDLVLRMIESGATTRDLTLDNPIRAIRDISRDTEGTQLVSLVGGRKLTAVQVQTEFLERVSTFAESRGLHRVEPYRRVLELWERTLKAIASQDLSLVETEIEWVMKLRMMQRYAEAHDLPMSHPRLQQLDLAWHDIHPTRGLYNILARRGQAATVTAPGQVQRARHTPPQTTRAKLRGDFVRVAQEHRRDFSVDWVHLKLNDAAQRTVLCKDPFVAH